MCLCEQKLAILRFQNTKVARCSYFRYRPVGAVVKDTAIGAGGMGFDSWAG